MSFAPLRRLALTCAVALSVSTFAAPAMAQTPPAPRVRTIEVSGMAERELTPDKAKLMLSVREYGEGRNTSKLSDIEATLLKAADKAGIKKEDVALQNVYGNQWYWRKKKEDYKQTRTYSIRVRTPEQAVALIEALDERAIQQAYVTDFELTNREAVEDELRAEALQKARKRAESMAKTYQDKVGKALAISDNTTFRNEQPMYKTGRMEAMSMDASGGGEPAPSITVDFEKITINSTAAVTFELVN